MSEELGAPPDQVTVVNETGLPDELVNGAVQDYFVEHSALAWGRQTTFQNYSGRGSMLARREYRTPTNVIDEIKLARDLAERDDDVAAAIGAMVATAFADGMENFHEDEKTVGLFNAAAREMNLDGVLKEFYREYLIAGSLTSVSLFTRENLEWSPASGESREDSIATPVSGVLHAENIRVIGDDTFGTAPLAYDPEDERLREWLRKYFSPETSPARKRQMGLENRVAANMFTGIVKPEEADEECGGYNGDELFFLNPRMVHRTTMPKGSWKYPRPLLTRDFALLEAKRLLNILDFALLQGGANFIVIVKKGTDERPATPTELASLGNIARSASKTGVIVGDHRLNIEVITPDLQELLNPEKRRLLGRKLASALLRIPEASVEQPGAEGMKTEVELLSRVITNDRHDIKRHIERFIYKEMVKRNKTTFTKGSPKVWFPKIVLQGTQFFTDYVLKLRDRGDIPRKWAVEAGGFDYESGVQQRQRELDAGDDETLAPAAVPFSSPEMGPQDNQEGRPKGAGPDSARPTKRIQKTPGESVRAYFDEEVDRVVRIGEVTQTILEEHGDYQLGRITSLEREALEKEEAIVRGGVMAVPVNLDVPTHEEKAARLRDGLSMIVGRRKTDGAFLAKVIVFREPEYSMEMAENAVARWGFPLQLLEEGDPPPPEDP